MVDFEKILLCPKIPEMSAFEQKGENPPRNIQKKGDAENEHVYTVE